MPNLNKKSNKTKSNINFGGYGDCGYRAIFGAFLFAHESGDLSEAQYQNKKLNTLLNKVSEKYNLSLSNNFPELSTREKLNLFMKFYKNSSETQRIQLIEAGAASLRSMSVDYSPKLKGFIVTDEKTLKGEDWNLSKRQVKEKTTWISALEIASASEVLQIPIEIADDRGLKHAEVYNVAGVQTSPIHIQLSGKHYTAQVDSTVLQNISQTKDTSTAKIQKALTGLSQTYKQKKHATEESNIAAIQQATTDIEQQYRNQREAIKKIVTNLTIDQLSHLYKAHQEDDYLSGKHGLETQKTGDQELDVFVKENLQHLIATAAWKNPEIAKAVQGELFRSKPEAAKDFKSQMEKQDSESIAPYSRFN